MKFHKNSIVKRVFFGVIMWIIIGIIYTLFFKSAWISLCSNFWIWTIIMFVLMWAAIWITGIFTKHPVFEFNMPWYFRWAVIGSVYMLMFVLLAYDNFNQLMSSSFINWTWLHSPFWAVLDWTFIWIFMSFIETKFGWEGPKLPIK